MVGVVVGGEEATVAVIETAVTTVAIEENQKQLRKNEVIKKMTMINQKLMKSQGVLMAIVVEDEEGEEEEEEDGVGSDVVHVVKVLAMKIIHLMGNVRTKRVIVPKVNEEHLDVVVAAAVDQDVSDEDQDAHLHRVLEMKGIETVIVLMMEKFNVMMKSVIVAATTETEK